MLAVKICLVSIHLKREFKCDWVIENNIVMTFALFNQFNQSEEKNWQEKKGVLENENGVTVAKANIQKGNIKKKLLKNSLNSTMHAITNIYIQQQINLQTIDINISS